VGVCVWALRAEGFFLWSLSVVRPDVRCGRRLLRGRSQGACGGESAIIAFALAYARAKCLGHVICVVFAARRGGEDGEIVEREMEGASLVNVVSSKAPSGCCDSGHMCI
jgi:hypothetical protein